MAAALTVQETMKIVTGKIHAMRRLWRQLASHFAEHVEDGAEVGAISWILKQSEIFGYYNESFRRCALPKSIQEGKQNRSIETNLLPTRPDHVCKRRMDVWGNGRAIAR